MKNSVNLILRLGLVLVLLSASGCTSSSHYTLKRDQPDVSLSGGISSTSKHTWPVTKGYEKLFFEGDGHPLAFLILGIPLLPVTALLDGIFGWHQEVASEPLAVSFPVNIQDSQAKPIANVPVTINGESASLTDVQGTLNISVVYHDHNPNNPKEPFSGSLQLQFPAWKSEFEEKGDAVEYLPQEIAMSVECARGRCEVVDANHKPIDKFVFTVNAIKHHDDKIVAAYQAKLAEAERERQRVLAEEERQRKEQEEEADRQRAERVTEEMLRLNSKSCRNAYAAYSTWQKFVGVSMMSGYRLSLSDLSILCFSKDECVKKCNEDKCREGIGTIIQQMLSSCEGVKRATNQFIGGQ